MSTRFTIAILSFVAVLIFSVLLLRRGDPGVDRVEVAIAGDTVVVEAVPPGAVRLLEEGRPWRAARMMSTHLRTTRAPSADAIFLAARAEGEWGGWAAVRDYLEGRPWLDDVAGGEGWYWLGRAREEAEDIESAIAAFERFLAIESALPALATRAELRLGLLHLRRGDTSAGETWLERVREHAPDVAEWLDLLSAESLAMAGDTAGVRRRIEGLPASAGMRHRGRIAWLGAFREVSDLAGLLRASLSLVAASGNTAAQRAELAMIAGRAAFELGEHDVARRELRRALGASPGSSSAREAAGLLLEVPGITIADRLTIADIDARHGNRTRAVEGYRTWLASGAGTTAQRAEVQLRLGRTLFDAGRLEDAEAALRPVQEAGSTVARQALLLTGRSQYRRGDQAEAFRTFERLASAHPGSVEASEGLYLVADLRHDAEEISMAAATYRRVADGFRGTDRAGLSLMRLAGIRYLSGDHVGAAAVWEEYRSTYPTGERWPQATYWAGRAYEAIGDGARARSLYEAVRRRDPLSYYAVRAADRLAVPYWPVPLTPAPPSDPEAAARVDGLLAGVDLLRDAALHREAEAELQRIIDRVGSDQGVRYSLAEALNERGYAIQGIRIGQALQRDAPGVNVRLLRILYPFPYRSLVEAEAAEHGLDPFVVAALMRQESLFTARITSPAGARGLMQIMPETGAALARGVDIDDWDPDLLYHPEINVHLGTRYLAEQMDRYDRSLPSVFSAYNAGPHRIDAWRSFPEFEDEELFTERIPYRETRDYVKILTRNIELYRHLYGETAETVVAGEAD